MFRRPKAEIMTSRCIRTASGVLSAIPLDADRGYLGIEAYHANRFIPINSRKNHQLTKKEKAYNKKLRRRSLYGLIPRGLPRL
jgi:hypothetical protein